MNRQIIPVILAGGSGQRLWPLSTESSPKQFLNLVSRRSLLQETVIRAKKVVDFSHMLIVTNAIHRHLCEEQLESTISGKTISYILEPCGRSTAPAITLAASYINESIDKEALMLVLPADHLIEDEKELMQSLSSAIYPAETGNLVIFGVTPNSPKTGYGYIQAGKQLSSSVYQVDAFVEKPNLDTARKYVSSGTHYWNSGIFLFQTTSYLHEIEKASPSIYNHCVNTHRSSILNGTTLFLDKKTFEKCPNDSIDYAVMEKTSKAIMVPLRAIWNDLGSWTSIAETQSTDANNNTIQGNVIEKSSTNCFVRSNDKLVSIIGLDNHIVVNTPDAVLVANKDYAEEIKEIKLTTDQRKNSFSWGYEELIEKTSFSALKRIVIRPESSFSPAFYDDFDKHWVIIAGNGELIMNGKKRVLLSSNQGIILIKTEHYEVKNRQSTPLMIIETTIKSNHLPMQT